MLAPEFIEGLFIFFFGLLIGSFLNAVIWRLHSGYSIFESSSVCPNCKHKLAAADLVPVLSFIWLGGKCRYCGKKISWQYPLVELATAISFVFIYVSTSPAFGTLPRPGEGWGEVELLFKVVFACFLIVVFVYDLRHYLVLDKVVFPAALLALLYRGYMGYQGDWGELGSALLGAVALSGFFGLLYLVSRGRWIGLGDVKLGIFLGLLIPWPQTIVLFFLAYFLGAAVSLPLLLFGGKKFSDRLPFGTFLTAAAFVAMLYGEEITAWYLRLIGY